MKDNAIALSEKVTNIEFATKVINSEHAYDDCVNYVMLVVSQYGEKMRRMLDMYVEDDFVYILDLDGKECDEREEFIGYDLEMLGMPKEEYLELAYACFLVSRVETIYNTNLNYLMEV